VSQDGGATVTYLLESELPRTPEGQPIAGLMVLRSGVLTAFEEVSISDNGYERRRREGITYEVKPIADLIAGGSVAYLDTDRILTFSERVFDDNGLTVRNRLQSDYQASYYVDTNGDGVQNLNQLPERTQYAEIGDLPEDATILRLDVLRSFTEETFGDDGYERRERRDIEYATKDVYDPIAGRWRTFLDTDRILTYRETLIMRLVEGMTGPEIAERTGLAAGSVRVNLHRGMKLLRERLGVTDAPDEPTSLGEADRG
jgi:hypothetical protein